MLRAGMSEQQPIESKPPVAPRTSGGGRRRGRRGGRGRGRGPRRTAPGAPTGKTDAPAPGEPEIQAAPGGEIAVPVPDAPVSEQSAPTESPAQQIEPPIRLREEMPVRPAPSKHKSTPHVPAETSPVHADKPHGSAIGKTVGEVRQIVESLEQALEQMVEVLRLVELAEHQKFADERELESLRRALHKLQPPRRERQEPNG